MTVKHIVFLVSGNGGNLKFFHLAMRKGYVSNCQLSVIGDRDCAAIDYARKNGLSNEVIHYQRESPGQLGLLLGTSQTDLIIANWHKIIDEHTVRQYRGRLINLHYSLLPAFKGMIGMEPVHRAHEQGCKFIGPTCHYVDIEVDAGKIISQGIFQTRQNPEDSVEVMFRKGCLVLLNAIQIVLGEQLSTRGGSPDNSFSPRLNFSAEAFGEAFWQELKNA